MLARPIKGFIYKCIVFFIGMIQLFGCGSDKSTGGQAGNVPITLTWGDYTLTSPAGTGWNLSDNKLTFAAQNSKKLRWVKLDTSVYDNFTLEVDITKIKGSLENLCGVIFRANENYDAEGFVENGYLTGLDQQTSFTVFKRVAGKSVLMEKWQNSPYLGGFGAVNHLKIVADGPVMDVYHNGSLIKNISDLSFQTGSIYLVYYDSGTDDEVQFSNFTLTPNTAVNISPVVAFTAPGEGATVSGENVTISASANDSDGSITKVEFYLGSELLGTDLSSPYQIVWNTKSKTNQSYTLKVKAYDNKGAASESARVVNVLNTIDPVTVSLNSISADDGYVKANSDGTSPSLGFYTTLAIGRGSDNKYNRAILSFDTSSLSGKTLTKAYLVVTYSSVSGDPWSSGNLLVIDVKKGTFGAAGIETADWAATATESGVAGITSFSSGTKQSADFSAAGLSAINQIGKTQVRLRFANNQSSTAYIFIKEGVDAKLYVEYQP